MPAASPRPEGIPVNPSRPRPGAGRKPGTAPAKGPAPSTARFVFFLAIGIAAVIGPQLYIASGVKRDTRNLMRSFCGSDQPCRDAVVRHFDSCWDSNASAGLFRKRVQIDREGLADCVNEAAGKRYFTYNEQHDYIGTPDP